MTSTGRLGRNVIAGAIGQACGIAVALVTTPLLVHGLGAADYGLWSVAAAVGSWVGFINMAFSTSAIRFVGEALGRGEDTDARAAYQALRVWALIGGMVVGTLLLGCAPWLARHALHVAPEKMELAIIALVAQAAFIFCQVQTAAVCGVVGAHQRLGIFYLIRTSGAVLQSGGAAGIVSLGHGLAAVVWWIVAMQALEWGVFAWWAHRLQPGTPPLTLASVQSWGQRFARYAGPLLVGYNAAQLFLPTSRLLLAMFRSLPEVAYFAIPATLAGNVRAFSTHVANAILPAASAKAGQHDLEGLKRLYVRGLRWSWLAMVPLAGLALALGGPFIATWIGPEFGMHVAPLIPPLVIGLSLQYLSGIPAVIAQGIGQTGPWALISVSAGVTNVLLGLVLVPLRGGRGAAEAICLAGGVSLACMVAWAHRTLRVAWREYLEACELRLLLVTATVTSALIVWGRGHPFHEARSVVVWGLLGAGLILVTAPWWLRADERAWCQRQWRALRGAR